MLDELLELILDLGGELVEHLLGRSLEKRKRKRDPGTKKKREKPPWEG